MKKGTLCLWIGIFGTVLGMSWGINANGRTEIAGMGATLFLVSLFALLPVGIYSRRKTKRDACNALSEEEKEKLAEERECKAEEAAQEWSAMKEEMRAARTIVSTAIVDTTMKSKTKASVGSSIVRGAVGSVFGPVGTIVGAATPKKTTVTKAKTVTFSVRYANGECRLETVKNGSDRFKELAKYIV